MIGGDAPRPAVRGLPRVLRGAAAVCAVSLSAAACLPRERTNATCRWLGEATALAPAGDPARRAHLIRDVRLAEDLGVRYADAVVGRPPPSLARWDLARRQCADAALAAVARTHGIPTEELTALSAAREPWIDALVVFLPMALLLAGAVHVAMQRLVGRGAPAARKPSVLLLAVWAPGAAALALAVTQMWGVVVEMARLGNGHISYRSFDLPASRHGWLVWGAALCVCVLSALPALRSARTTWPMGEHRPDSAPRDANHRPDDAGREPAPRDARQSGRLRPESS